MRLFSLFCLVLTTCVLSQRSIGFRYPADKTPITSYQLPTWGYKTTAILFSSEGGGQKWDDVKMAAWGYSTNAGIRQTLYRENDKSRRTFSGELGTFFQCDKGYEEQIYYEQFDYGRSQNASLNLDWQAARYFNDLHHFKFDANLQSTYADHQEFLINEEKEKWENGRTDIHRRISSRLSFGYGSGRIRNVTPVILALRFRERYAALGVAEELTNEQVQEIARTFAQYSGYQRVYDREDKYFWDAILKSTGADALSPFQMYYLRETFEENTGARYEGWEITLQYEFRTAHSRESIDGYWRNTTHKFGIDGHWYKNLNLNHQLEFYLFPGYRMIDQINGDQRIFDVEASINHLWIIADRLMLSSYIRTNYYDMQTQLHSEDYNSINRYYRFGSTLTLFIEDHLSLNSYVNWTTVDDRSTWNVYFGLTYLIDRSLR